MCEGGATLNWSVLASGMVDRIQAYIAPKVLGGVNALSPVGGMVLILLIKHMSLMIIRLQDWEGIY